MLGETLRLTVLGSGGWMPTAERQTSCYLLRSGAQALILDAGTGLANLHRRPQLLEGVEQLTIVLSHFHLDHVAGLTYLSPRLLEGRRLTIWGPGAWLYRESTRSLLGNTLCAQPLQTRSPLESADWQELNLSPLSFAGLDLSSWEQTKHTLPSAGLRLGDALAYCTDTEYDGRTTERVSGVELLLHEAWGSGDVESGHTSGGQAASIARDARVGRLLLTHLNPLPGVARRTFQEARLIFPGAELAEDGLEITL